MALVLCCGVMVGPFAAGGVAQAAKFPCGVPGQIKPHPQEWHSIKGPRFPAGSPVISGFAVEPIRPDYIYVTNGISVMRTTDSGCSWQEAYTLPPTANPAGFSAQDSVIQEIEVSAPGVVYLPIQQKGPAGLKPHVVASTDGGASWRVAEGGLMAGMVGLLLDFDAPLADPGKAYALVNVEQAAAAGVSLDTSQVLLETSDAGATWSVREVLDDGTTVNLAVVSFNMDFGGFEQITADPVRGEEVWLWGEAQTVKLSPLGFQPIALSELGALSISFDGSLILAYEDGASTGHVSVDGGADFTSFRTGLPITSAAAITATGFAPIGAAEGAGRSFYHLAQPGTLTMAPLEITSLNQTRISGIQVGIREDGPNGLPFEPLVYGHTASTVEVRAFPRVPEPPRKTPGEIISDLIEPPTNRTPGVLEPREATLKLRPGEAGAVDYGLSVPAASTPLDVYFLIDVSGSMGGTIDGVRSAMQEIVNRLSESGADVHFGVGAFRAFGDPPAYARVRDIGPVNSDLTRALNSLNANGGGAETQMTALYQSVTGEGENGIPPDLDMTFRPGSLRVAILSTDEPISQGGAHRPVSQVIEALDQADVKQVALAIQDPPLLGDHDYDRPGEPASTLQQVATGSGAIAPIGGVDCDGDGDVEIGEGGPIVCILSAMQSSQADTMADAIVNVLAAIQDIQDVQVNLAKTDASVNGEIVESVEPGGFPQIDLKDPQDLAFRVTVRCPKVENKRTYPLEVDVGTAERALGRADLTVICNPKIVPEEPAPPPPPVFVPLLALPFPPVRPPEPIPEPNPNPQPNPQSNPQAQAGMASQEQKQPQLAAVHQEAQMQLQPDTEEAGGEQFLMTAHEQSQGVQPGAVFVTGAVLMTMIYGFATMRREQLRTQQERRRPWDR